MTDAQRSIEIIDVGPRDGLQNEAEILDIDTKVEFIRRLADAGIRRMEAVSFVSPKRVPQMAEAEEVLAALPDDDGVTYIGLVLNRRGLDRALEAGCREVNYALVASDTFSQKNQGTTIEQAVDVYEEIAAEAKAAGARCSLTISTAFGCPFQGEVPPERVVGLVERVAGDDTYEIALADTIGCAVPSQVSDLFGSVMAVAPAPASARISTTPGIPASPTATPRPRLVSSQSMHPRAGLEVVRSPLGRPAMSLRKISSTCLTEWVSKPVSISKS